MFLDLNSFWVVIISVTKVGKWEGRYKRGLQTCKTIEIAQLSQMLPNQRGLKISTILFTDLMQHVCPTSEIIQRCLEAKNSDLEDLFKE